jgi:predicted esterase
MSDVQGSAARQAPLEGTTPIAWRAAFRLRIPAFPAPAAGHPVLLGLHGYGDDAARLDDRLSALDGAPYARLYLDAPFPVSVEAGDEKRIGRSWYAYDGDQERFLDALAFAEGYLRDALGSAAQAAPIDPTRVVLLGYSQGGYLAGVAALRDRARYRGLVCVAGRVKTEALAAELPRARGYPALLVHGARDAHTALDRQREAADVLLRHGVAVELATHDGGHGLPGAIVPRIDAFVRRVLGLAAASEDAR